MPKKANWAKKALGVIPRMGIFPKGEQGQTGLIALLITGITNPFLIGLRMNKGPSYP